MLDAVMQHARDTLADAGARSALRLGRSLLHALGATVAWGVAAVAQVPVDSLASGARVRLRAPVSGIPWRSVGTMDSLARDTVFLHGLRDPRALQGARLAVPLDSVERLDVSVHRASRIDHAGRGALWGLGAYAVFATALIAHESSTCKSDCFGEGMAWIGIAGGVPVAAGIGAAMGFALPVERWRPVRLR